MCSLFYISRGRKRDIIHDKMLMYGFASFWFSIALARIYFFFADYFLEGTYSGDLSQIYLTFNTINYVLMYFYLYLYIFILVSVVSLSIIFIWFSIRSSKEFKAISSIMTIGYAVFLVGWVFETMVIKYESYVAPSIPPILMIIGALVAMSPLIIDLQFFAKSFVNWIIIVSIAFIFLALCLTLFTQLPTLIIIQIIIIFASFVLVFALLYISINVYKVYKSPKSLMEDQEKELRDFIRAFSKPQRITEEEVQMYKQKMICLVCKSHISRVNYVCPECNALYCIKCSNALSNLENACWVCDTPFDESRPIQPHEVVEEALGFEEQIIAESEVGEPHKALKKAKKIKK
ncbi:MAG: hypothetical protein ACFFCV_01580 [Promethearchaeota archaeon]